LGCTHESAAILSAVSCLTYPRLFRSGIPQLLIEDVQVTGWHIQIRLRIPLGNPPDGPPHGTGPQPGPAHPDGTALLVSTKDRLRAPHEDEMGVAQQSTVAVARVLGMIVSGGHGVRAAGPLAQGGRGTVMSAYRDLGVSADSIPLNGTIRLSPQGSAETLADNVELLQTLAVAETADMGSS
jgi:hypothetical protein